VEKKEFWETKWKQVAGAGVEGMGGAGVEGGANARLEND